MATSVPRLLVVGGNGYLGSAVCKAAVGKGWEVSSMSSSGRPFTSPAGHTPKWVHQVKWHRASAFEPGEYAELVSNSSAVVHTLGILLEDAQYKQKVASGDIFGLARAMAMGATGSGAASNPLMTSNERRETYGAMNRDSAWTVLDTMIAAKSPLPPPRSFVYISADQSFSRLVPEGYIKSKLEAEAGILERCTEGSGILPLLVRPGLMYEPHIRPVSTLPAFALSLTAGMHDAIKFPTPFSRNSFLGRAAESMTTHPIHVDHVADAIVRAIGEEREGVLDVATMRRWAGFKVPEAEA